MPRIEVSRGGGRHGILAQTPGTPAAHGDRRHDLRLGPITFVALLPLGPVHVVAISTLPVSHNVRVVRRLRWLYGRRRRRLSYRGHGRARRLAVRAAAAVVSRLIRVIYSIAVLGPVYNSHIMVAHPRHVLAVFIIPCAAAVLHRAAVLCSAARRQRWDPETRVAGAFLAVLRQVAAEPEVAAMTCVATSASATNLGAAAAAISPRKAGLLSC